MAEELRDSDSGPQYDALGRQGVPRAALVETGEGEDSYQRIAGMALSDLGIEVEGEWVRIASSSPKLSKLLKDTPWAGDGWNRHLLSLPGAQEGRRRAFRGLSRRRTVEVPLSLVMDRTDPAPIPQDVEEPW